MSSITVSQVQIATQKVAVEAEYTALINGFASDLAGVDPIVLVGVSYARAAILAKFQSRIDGAQATKSARGALRTAVSNEQALAAEVDPLRQAMKQYLQSRFGKSSPKLQDFGFTEAKVPSKTAASRAGAATKAQATRKARGILGKKQRLAIKAPIAPTVTTSAVAASPSSPATATPLASAELAASAAPVPAAPGPVATAPVATAPAAAAPAAGSPTSKAATTPPTGNATA